MNPKARWHTWDEDFGVGSATTRISLGDVGHYDFDTSSLPKAADIRYMWLNGHGPVKPERQSIIFYQNRPSDTDFACDVPHCQKCITEYKKELNFPYLDEHEVFV